MTIAKEVRQIIEKELQRYPVSYSFGHGGAHPYVEITTNDGLERRIPISNAARNGNAALNLRSDIRRTLRAIQVAPIGTFGKKLVEAGIAEGPERLPDHDNSDELELASLPPALCPDAIRDCNPKEGPPMLKKIEDAAAANNEAVRHYAKLRQDEIVLITRLLSKHATIDDDKRLVTYEAGWSDERILSLLKAAPGRDLLRLDHVAVFRRENFGKLLSEVAAPSEFRGNQYTSKVLVERVDNIEARLAKLEAELGVR